jgi:AcrR family transcriptional regulator
MKIMSGDVTDRRVQKTCRLLQDALIALIAEKGYESVTIREILDRANVGRSTFYMHFDNKNELLHSCFSDFRDLLEKHNAEISSSRKQFGNIKEIDFIINFFRFVERNHRLFKALLGKDSMPVFHQPLYDYVSAYIKGWLKMSIPKKMQTSTRMERLEHYLASGFIGTVKWWIDQDMPCTVEEMDQYFKRLWDRDFSEIL